MLVLDFGLLLRSVWFNSIDKHHGSFEWTDSMLRMAQFF
ncbi:hypothetical protein EVA_01496 [gut metagenome]|uniref:Uncharacterized protein n=1 Tax=gut metagenome TaxID=749906 RepID=J9H314_9ZZZZ